MCVQIVANFFPDGHLEVVRVSGMGSHCILSLYGWCAKWGLLLGARVDAATVFSLGLEQYLLQHPSRFNRHDPLQMHAGARQAHKQQAPANIIKLGDIAFGQHHRRCGLPLEATHRVNREFALGPDGRAALVIAPGKVSKRPSSELIQVLKYGPLASAQADDDDVAQGKASL